MRVQNKDVMDFMVQGKINRGRHTDNPAGRHSIRAHLHHPPHIFYRPDALPAAQPTVSKHWRQLAQYQLPVRKPKPFSGLIYSISSLSESVLLE